MAKRFKFAFQPMLQIPAASTPFTDSLGLIGAPVGTNGNDNLTGTSGPDLILGRGGDDLIKGLAGDDALSGDAGNDRMFGGDGTDVLAGGTGNDYLSGGNGNDVMIGGAGADTLIGGAGIDTVSYTESTAGVRVDLRGLPSNGGPQPEDVIQGVENIIGGSGDDTILGSAGSNLLDGGVGSDIIFGEGGRDTLFGGGATDRLFGGDGRDALFGGAGADFLTGGKGADILTGGEGADQFIFGTLSADGTNDVILDFEVGLDKFVVADQQGGPGGTVAVTFSGLRNGNTLVTIGSLDDPFYEIEVRSTGGTISQSDIQFSFLG